MSLPPCDFGMLQCVECTVKHSHPAYSQLVVPVVQCGDLFAIFAAFHYQGVQTEAGGTGHCAHALCSKASEHRLLLFRSVKHPQWVD